MDAFFASVEQRDFPELRGKPIAVGGSSERGVVAAASYEARKYGVRSAMPSKIAARLCPHLIFVKHRFDVYRSVSQQIMDIFKDYTDLVEPLSLDEAYLDVTHNKIGMPSATLIAQEIRARIKEETQLTASAGISTNKFLAKVASDINKPNGLTLIPPDEAEAFIEGLPIEKFHGIGKVTAAKMKKLGINTGADLKKLDRIELSKRFGKAGSYYYRIVRGEDNREVTPDRIRKSIGAEQTFQKDISGKAEVEERVAQITEIVSRRMEKNQAAGKTITLKIKYFDFQVTTRSKTVNQYLSKLSDLLPLAKELLYQPEFPPQPIRLLGVSLSNLDTEIAPGTGYQLTLDL